MSNKKLSKNEQFKRVQEKAREIEEMALRNEQILNVRQNGDLFKRNNSQSVPILNNGRNERNIEDALEVNEMLVDAIKAKLAILDDMMYSKQQ